MKTLAPICVLFLGFAATACDGASSPGACVDTRASGAKTCDNDWKSRGPREECEGSYSENNGVRVYSKWFDEKSCEEIGYPVSCLRYWVPSKADCLSQCPAGAADCYCGYGNSCNSGLSCSGGTCKSGSSGDCPAGCRPSVGSTMCCGGAFCSGNCIGTPCCR